MENLCQRVSVTLGQHSSNGQNCAIVCPRYTLHPWTVVCLNLTSYEVIRYGGTKFCIGA